MSAHWTHLVAMPIVLPVMAAGVLLLVERAGIGLQRAIALLATLAQAGVALALLVQADAGAVTAYLVGDQDLAFRDFLQMFFDAAGNAAQLQVVDQEHPLLPDVAIPQGRGNWVHVDPPADEVALLGYRRNDVRAAIEEVVAQYRG